MRDISSLNFPFTGWLVYVTAQRKRNAISYIHSNNHTPTSLLSQLPSVNTHREPDNDNLVSFLQSLVFAHRLYFSYVVYFLLTGARNAPPLNFTYSIDYGLLVASIRGIFLFLSYNIHYCFICRPSDSTVPTDAGIEPRTVAIVALAVRRFNH